nr:hypothetical protein [Pandoravirus massiliensis]
MGAKEPATTITTRASRERLERSREQRQQKFMATHREHDGDIIAAVRREIVTAWSAHPDVWAISVQCDANGEPFALFGLGDNAAHFPNTLVVDALNGCVVPLRTEVVGRIVPL